MPPVGQGDPVLGTIGAVLGILVAVVVSYLIYRGLVRINLSRFFFWTGLFLIVVAAGVLAYGIHDLQEAGVIPGVTVVAYSLAGIIPPTSWYGAVLAGIFNFTPEPTVAQVIVWVAYVAITLVALPAGERFPADHARAHPARTPISSRNRSPHDHPTPARPRGRRHRRPRPHRLRAERPARRRRR